MDLILAIAECSGLEEILALSQLCSKLRRPCSQIYLTRIGILKVGRITTEIRILGGPFSGQIVSLLKNLQGTSGSLPVTLIVDFYHITSFRLEFQSLLRNITISSFEIDIFDDEHDLLDNDHLTALLIVLSNLSDLCECLRLIAKPSQSSRSLSSNLEPTCPPIPGHLLIQKALSSLTEIHLSTYLFSHHPPLQNTIAPFLLHHQNVEYLSLSCSTAIKFESLLSQICLPVLESLSIQVGDDTLAVLPLWFLASHPNLHDIYLSSKFSWNEASFQPSGVRILLPSITNGTIPSKYAGFDILDSSTLRHLHVYSYLSFPVPEHLGFCRIVASLVDIWLSSHEFRPVDDFTASFTFPCRLSDHLAFFKEKNKLRIHQCSNLVCSSDSTIPGVRHVKIFVDRLTQPVIVSVSVTLYWIKQLNKDTQQYLSQWVQHFPDVQQLSIVAKFISNMDIVPIKYFQRESGNIQHVNLSTRDIS